MKNITSKVLIFLCLIFVINTKAQVPPDSLPGHYIGEYWFRVALGPWTISTDTVWVTNVSAEQCFLGMWIWDGGHWNVPFHTHYDYCYGNPDNFYQLFHSGDSLEIVADFISTPPPNNEIQSHRFYGKKAYIPVGLVKEKAQEALRVFPNPAGEYLRVSGVEAGTIYSIRSLAGNEVQSGEISGEGRISTAGLKPGCYLLQCITENEVSHLKFIRR